MSKNQSNFRQALWLGISQASTFVVVFLSGAILSRYFPKCDYGTYKQVMFVYTTLNVIFTAGLVSVFPFFIPRYSKEEGKTIVNKVTFVLLLLGGVFSVFLFLTSGLIANLLNNPDLEGALKYFCLAPLFTLPALGVEGLYTALRKTQYVVIYQVGGKLFLFLCCILPVLLWNGTYKEAIIGWVFASFLSFLMALVMKGLPYRHIKAKPVDKLYKQVFDYSLPLMSASLVGLAFHSANQFFISRYCGQSVFAEYSNGYLALPIVPMIAGSIKSVLVPLFSKASKEGNMNDAIKSYESSLIKCVTLVFPFIFFCFLFSQDIMSLAFGKNYASSGSYFRCSLINDMFACLPYLAIILALGGTKAYFRAHLYVAIAIWAIDFILVVCHITDPILFAIIFTVLSGFTSVYMFLYIKNKLNIVLLTKRLKRRLLKIIFYLLIITIVIAFIHHLCSPFVNPYINLCICGLLFFTIVSLSGQIINEDFYLGSVKRLFHEP